MKTAHILSLSLLPISLLLVSCGQDAPTSISPSDVPSLARSTNIDAFDMNGRFSGSGANGNGTAKVTDGQINLTIHGRDLEVNHPYEVHLIVGPEGNPDLDVDNLTAVHVFPVTSDKNGKLKFDIKGFDLGLDPGNYRLDFLVLHPGIGAPEPTDFLLACQPAPLITIE